MTHFQLTLSNVTFSFRPQIVLLAGAASIGGVLLMSVYVGTLQESVQRGETLRKLQREGAALTAAAQGESGRRAPAASPKLVTLIR